MPIGNWNLQWLNHNSQRSYPLTERATKTDVTNTVRIPDSFIVALYLPIHAGLAVLPENFFLKSILIAPTGYNISIGYNDGDTYPTVAAVNIAKSTYAPNRGYALGGIDDFADTVGQIVIGRLDEIDSLPPGLYEFLPEAGEIEPDAIRPMIRGISSIQVDNNAELSQRIYGDILLVAGSNMRIDVALGTTPTITFNAISGENLNEDCVCDDTPPPPCIQCINGQCSGTDFPLVDGECVQILPTTNGIKLVDTCAQPCCGCEELNALKLQLDRFGDGVTTLQNFVTRLGSEVTQMSLVVLGSRLGDTGCNTC
jgi:hypothetical protein